MNSLLNFIYRDKLQKCKIYIGQGDDPTMMYIILIDRELIAEFGEEITIKTDFIKKVLETGNLQGTAALKQAIFHAARFHPAFLLAKEKRSASLILRSTRQQALALRLRQPYSFAGPAWE